jgi:cell division protein FtsI (penicillin-binding protein 3)
MEPVHKQSERRLRVVAGLFLVWALCIAGRLFQLQIVQHEALKHAAASQQQATLSIPALRGDIIDRTGHPLAVSIPTYSLSVNPQQIKNAAFFAASVASTLGLDEEELRARLEELKSRSGKGRDFFLLKHDVTKGEIEGLKRKNFGPDVFQFFRDSRREYPNTRVASHVVGSVNASGQGDSGVEQKLNAELSGRPSQLSVLRDAMMEPYVTKVIDPGQQGANVTLTIHNVIQNSAERALADGVRESGAHKGSVVVMDPNTGEVLALANYPDFDPSNPKPNRDDFEARLNTAVQAPCEPGSVMKMITVTMALESGRFKPETPIYCENGTFARPGRPPIHDAHRMGLLDVAGVLIHSSNIGVAKISIASGPEMLYSYLKKFGIGDRTHVELPGETGGILWPQQCGATNSDGRPLPCWTPASHEYIAFGHEVGATAIQLARAVSVIANGGLLVSPHLVLKEERRTPDGAIESIPRTLPEPRRVVRAETAFTIRKIMQGVVLEGTGRRAKVPGYTVGGKTGSAEIFDQETHTWLRKRHNSSFIGFAPVTNPRVVVVVTLNYTPEQGGIAAAPVFSKVAATALRIMQVPKDDPDSDLKAPRQDSDVSDEPATEPLRRASKEKTVEPEPAQELVSNRMYVAGPRVPDFTGKRMLDVMRESMALGLPVETVGTGIARDQSPAPGKILPVGEKIRVDFGR